MILVVLLPSGSPQCRISQSLSNVWIVALGSRTVEVPQPPHRLCLQFCKETLASTVNMQREVDQYHEHIFVCGLITVAGMGWHRIPVGTRFFVPVQPGPVRPHPASRSRSTRSLPKVRRPTHGDHFSRSSAEFANGLELYLRLHRHVMG